MPNTHDGAMKALAAKRGLLLDELIGILQTHSFCYGCNLWLTIENFNVDKSRFNGLHRKCVHCRRIPAEKKIIRKGRPSILKGRKHTPEARLRMSLAQRSNTSRRGENHPRWKGGVTLINEQIRKSAEYCDWRSAVFLRDNFTCQHCGDEAGSNLHAHHIKAFAQYPEHRFDVSNGITLCETCHWEVHSRSLSPEDIYLIDITYKHALTELGGKTKLARLFHISPRTLSKIINRTHKFEEYR